MKTKEILYCEIGDFYVEAGESDSGGEKTAEFWIGRKEYGIKVFMFGIPWSEVPKGNLDNLFVSYLFLLTDRGFMDSYIEQLLEGEEVDDYFKIVE